MTPKELEAFIAKQERMSARIAKKAARGRLIAKSYGHVLDSKGRSLGDRIERAISRPGVAPATRPISKDGGQTFHFAMTSINRTSDFKAKTAGAKGGLSAAHERYIEREGAAESIESDLIREAKSQDREGWLALGGQAYIERPQDTETLNHGRTLASFGNIADRFEERVRFWEASEAAASQPRSHGLIIDLSKDERFWAVLTADESAPAVLKKAWRASIEARDRVIDEAERATKEGRGVPNVPMKVESGLFLEDGSSKRTRRSQAANGGFRLTDKQAIEVHDYLRMRLTRAKAVKENPACYIEPGRGGRIQNRLIVELPFELSPEARLDLAKDFCHKKFVEGRECALPHWCVIHAPDHHNDPRNTHMHIVFSERPCRRVVDTASGDNVWDFEIVETYKDVSRTKRTRRPLEQPTDRTLHAKSWIGTARKDYAKLANEALKKTGINKIYDPRSYKEMGIEGATQWHVSPKIYQQEKQGVSTKEAAPLIRAQWMRDIDRLGKVHSDIKPNSEIVSAFDREMKRWGYLGQGIIVWSQLVRYRHMYREASVLRQHHAAEGAANAHILKRIHSKLIPPLATEGPPEELVTQFSKMWTNDLITHNRLLAESHGRREALALRALKTAQKLRIEDAEGIIDIGNGKMLERLMDLGAGLMHPGRGEWSATEAYEAQKASFLSALQQARQDAAERKVAERATIAAGLAQEAQDRERNKRAPWGPRPEPSATEMPDGQPAAHASAAEKGQLGNVGPRPERATEALARARNSLAEARAAKAPTVLAFLSDTGPVIQRRVVPYDVKAAARPPGRASAPTPAKRERAPFVPTERVKVDLRVPKAVGADWDFTAPREPLLASEIAAAELARKAALAALEPARPSQEDQPAAPAPAPNAVALAREILATNVVESEKPPGAAAEPVRQTSATTAKATTSASSTATPSDVGSGATSSAGQVAARAVIQPDGRAFASDRTRNEAWKSSAEAPPAAPTPDLDATDATVEAKPATPPGGASGTTSTLPYPPKSPEKKKRQLTREEVRRRALLARSKGREFER